jgi:hypothetical protein
LGGRNFQKERPAGRKESRGLPKDPREKGKPILSAIESKPRLKISHLFGQVPPLLLGNVRGIGHDEVEFSRDLGEAVGAKEVKGYAEPLGVPFGRAQGAEAFVHGPDLRIGPGLREGDGQNSCACADI